MLRIFARIFRLITIEKYKGEIFWAAAKLNFLVVTTSEYSSILLFWTSYAIRRAATYYDIILTNPYFVKRGRFIQMLGQICGNFFM